MSRHIVEFVHQYHVCQMQVGRKHSKYGFLHPLAIPTRPFWSISLDLISGLSRTSQGHDAIITVFDRFTKLFTFDFLSHSHIWCGRGYIFIGDAFLHFGFPGDIVSNNTCFTSGFQRELYRNLGIHLSMSSAWLPVFDGSTKVVNNVVELPVGRMLFTC
jgi:hypothetical protein